MRTNPSVTGLCLLMGDDTCARFAQEASESCLAATWFGFGTRSKGAQLCVEVCRIS